ncbi:glycosyltransferase [Pedobacter sp. GSP4]|uniref:glycosyltransferase n=1 Tax=Pedobacter sp. GSP4 TaxID=3453716 RepID=UPI003EE98096
MSSTRLIIYFVKPPIKDRFFWGDRYILPTIRKLIRGERISSLELVFKNLCKAFDLVKQPYLTNIPFDQITERDHIIVLGLGLQALNGYHQTNKLVAGIGLMTHPSNWPTLFVDYPVATYLQHSKWTADIYNKWFGKNKCSIWPAGIDTEFWKPKPSGPKTDILIYVKFLWDQEQNRLNLLKPIIAFLEKEQISHQLIVYGAYDVKTYKGLLASSKGMIFLCEHESQGLAYQEALSMNVPILAWDQGLWLDPSRFEWGETAPVKATSVPYFDERCGDKFKNLNEFYHKFPMYYAALNHSKFSPRDYILENLSLEKSAEKMSSILNKVYSLT